MRRGFVVVAAILLAALGVWPVRADTFDVKVRDDYFTPDFRVVVVGDTVRWTVEGVAGHTITSYPGSPTAFDSSEAAIDSCEPVEDDDGDDGGLLGGGGDDGDDGQTVDPDCLTPGATFEQTFDHAGTVDYYCKIHGDPSKRPDPAASAGAQPCGMCGRIRVQVPSSERPATRRPVPEPWVTETATEQPSESPSAEPGTSDDAGIEPDPSLVAGADTDDGGAGGIQALLVTAAIAVLIGLGVLVWRRYLAPAE